MTNTRPSSTATSSTTKSRPSPRNAQVNQPATHTLSSSSEDSTTHSNASSTASLSSGPTTSLHDDADLEKIKKALVHDKSFLGHPDLFEHVEWVGYGRKWILASKASEREEIAREPAVVQWVGEISPHNFWLYPCAGWNGEHGPNGDWDKSSPFETAKARANIRCPSQAVFAIDWKACMQNLMELMDAAKRPNSRTALNLIQDNEVKVRHSVFEMVCFRHGYDFFKMFKSPFFDCRYKRRLLWIPTLINTRSHREVIVVRISVLLNVGLYINARLRLRSGTGVLNRQLALQVSKSKGGTRSNKRSKSLRCQPASRDNYKRKTSSTNRIRAETRRSYGTHPNHSQL